MIGGRGKSRKVGDWEDCESLEKWTVDNDERKQV
jgi:hypothetical protein